MSLAPPAGRGNPPGAPRRRPARGLLLIGAAGRESGKTELACRILRRFGSARPVVAGKVTTVHGHEGPCPRGGPGCGACDLEGVDYILSEEAEAGSGKDTSRLLAAGASRVLWLRVRADCLSAGVEALLAEAGPTQAVVAESNSLALVAEPDLFLAVRSSVHPSLKPSARQVAELVDRWVSFDGSSFDLDIEALQLESGRWTLAERARHGRLVPASAAVLAGVRSLAAGRDRGAAPSGAQAPAGLLLEQLQTVFAEALVIPAAPDRTALCGPPAAPAGEAGQEQLAGAACALSLAAFDRVLLAAGDAPGVDLDLARRLIAATEIDIAAIPTTGPDRHNLPCIACRRSVLPFLQQALARGRKSILEALDEHRIETVPVDWAPASFGMSVSEGGRAPSKRGGCS